MKCKLKSRKKTFQWNLKDERKTNILNKEAVEMSKMIQNRKENYFHELSLKLNN